MKLALILTLFALPVMAETPLTGDAFEDLVAGKTLTFSNGLAPYGVEYYAPNRRVIWSFVGGECVNGEWYEEVRETGLRSLNAVKWLRWPKSLPHTALQH